jgi:hypothetical protein
MSIVVRNPVGRCRLTASCPCCFQRLKLKYDNPLSNFACNVNSCPYHPATGTLKLLLKGADAMVISRISSDADKVGEGLEPDRNIRGPKPDRNMEGPDQIGI